MNRHRHDSWPDRLVLALIVVTPLLVGTVHAATILGAGMVALAALVLELRRAQRAGEQPSLTLPGLGLAVGLGFTLLQALPLPAALAGALSPGAAELRALTAPAGPAAWFPLSLDPAATLRDALRFGGLLAAFLLAVNRFSASGRSMRRICGALVITAGAVSAIGLLHKLVGAEAILGVYPTPAITKNFFTATFVNPNHLAGYLGLLAPLAIGLAIETRDSWLRPTCALAAVFIALGAMLSLSRGGIVAFVAGQLFLAVLLVRRRLAGRRGPVALAPLVAGLVVAVSAYLAYEEISAELQTMDDPAELSAYDKFRSWEPLGPMMRDFPLTGIGRGAFATVYPRYKTLPARGTWTHPENEVLQVLVEHGPAVGGLVLALLAVALVGLALRPRASALSCGGLAGLFACSLHNLVDFNLETGAVGLAFFSVLGLLVGRWMRSRPEGARVPAWPRLPLRAALLAAGGLLALGGSAGVWAASHALPAETARLEALEHGGAGSAAIIAEARAQVERRPADYHPVYAMARAYYEDGDLDRAGVQASIAAQLNPTAFEPHELSALVLAQRGQHRQAWASVRRAAELAPAPDALLDRWYGNYPGTTAWLSMTPDTREARLHLARRLVRSERKLDARAAMTLLLLADPGDYEVRLAAADVALADGRKADARTHLRRALAIAPARPEAYLALARLTLDPAAGRRLLEQGLAAAPGQAQLTRALVGALSRAGELDRAGQLCDELERAAGLDPRRRAQVERTRASIDRARKRPFRAIEHLVRAVELVPEDEGSRRTLARLFEQTGQLEQAAAEYRVLVARYPAREDLKQALQALEAKLGR